MPEKLIKKNDAYGAYLMEYYKRGHVGPEIVERSDGYVSGGDSVESGYGAKVYFSNYHEWPENEKVAIELAREKVLDVGCGAGRHLLYLQSKNIDSVGIDISPLAVEVCKLRGAKNVLVRSITNLNKFKRFEFKTILMMDNNFGLFGNLLNARKILSEMYRITTKDALIIADATDPEIMDDEPSIIYKARNLENSKLSGQLKIRVRYLNMKSKWFDYLLASKAGVKEIIRGTGWQMKNNFDGDNGAFITVLSKLNG